MWWFHSHTGIPMPCEEVPMQSMQQIWPFFKSMLPKEDSGASQEQSQKPQSTSTSCRSNVCARQFQSQSFRRFQLWWVILLQLQIQSNHAEGEQIPNPIHLIRNLAYQLKLHHTRNMYLQAQLDTCADVNIMPASVYWLVFKDPEWERLNHVWCRSVHIQLTLSKL